jgi:hypothetical protein
MSRGMARYFAVPKGQTDYAPAESFLLHVFCETPSVEAALTLIEGLRGCAIATHRDTPCVPTYFFRTSLMDSELVSPTPQIVSEHTGLRDAKKRIAVGIPLSTVRTDMLRRGLDPALLDLDDSALLPEAIRNAKSVAVEFTEIYLDERAFMHHSWSPDYLDAYGKVMSPALMRAAKTVRLGTPVPSLVEKILEPILKEVVFPLQPDCFLWSQHPPVAPLFLALDVPHDTESKEASSLISSLPLEIRQRCVSIVSFPHLLRLNTLRVQMIFPSLPSVADLRAISAWKPSRGEVFLESISNLSDEKKSYSTPSSYDIVKEAFDNAGLDMVTVRDPAREPGSIAGFIMHKRSSEIVQGTRYEKFV